MSGSMVVIYIEKTGHVVAAMSATVDTGAPEVAALVGTRLPLRTTKRSTNTDDALVFAPAEILKAKSLPLDEAVLANPLAFAVDGSQVAMLPDAFTVATDTIVLSTTSCAVKYGTVGVAQDMEVVTMLLGPDPANANVRAQSNKILAGATTATMLLAILPGEAPAAIPTGTYSVCAAFPGQRLVFARETA